MTAPAEYLDAPRLLALLSPGEALRAMQTFFASNTRESVAAPTRIHMPVPGSNTLGLYMPAASPHYVAVKIVHLMPERRPAVEAEVFLYDAETGRLLFWGDGKPLTALRTAAVSVAASRRLLANCRSLLVFGAGVQAAAHLVAFADGYPHLEKFWAATRGEESFRRLRALLPEALRERVKPAIDPAALLAKVDCVVGTTPAPEPLFRWEDAPPELHVVGIGSATPAMNEIPPQAFLQSTVWVDTHAALEEAGDCLAAVKAGWNPGQVRGDLFDLLGANGENAGAGRKGPTLFKSVGHAAQDLAILTRIWERLKGL